MTKKRLVLALVIILLLAGGFYLLHSHHKAKPTVAPGSTSIPSNPPKPTNMVSAQGYTFSPADIKVKVGTTVTWTNKDSGVAYSVVEDDGQTGGPSSSPIPPNQVYTFKFTKAGLYHYHNSLDPNMTGTVTVEP